MSRNFAGGQSAQYVTFSYVLGIAGLDRSGFDKYNPNENRGKPIFDDDFDISSAAAQQALVQICSDASTWYACGVLGLRSRVQGPPSPFISRSLHAGPVKLKDVPQMASRR